MQKFFGYLETKLKNMFLAIGNIARNTTTKIYNLINATINNKYMHTVGLVALTVYLSVAVNQYYRPIQEVIHKGIYKLNDFNEPMADFLYEANGYLLNGKAFDAERRNKHAIYSAYAQVVMVNVIPKNLEDMTARTMSGRGTGWFYQVEDQYAYIVTNHHVIDGAIQNDALKISVGTAQDMWDYDAEIVGVDEVADIAVIKIYKKDNEEWESLAIANHKETGVGDPVAIMGHGLGLPFTATTGIVTYKDRYGSRPYNLMLQVDAVINQGNSGGPVINMDGELVGVAQSILSPARQVPGWDGIGLAVNAKTTQRSIDYILGPQYNAKGYVPYAELPMSMKSREYDDVKDIAKDQRHHAVIDYVGQAPNAEKTVGELAGLQQGDIILEINGDKIYSTFSVLRMIMYAFPGDEWNVTVARGEEIKTITLALREMDREKLVSAVRRGGR